MEERPGIGGVWKGVKAQMAHWLSFISVSPLFLAEFQSPQPSEHPTPLAPFGPSVANGSRHQAGMLATTTQLGKGRLGCVMMNEGDSYCWLIKSSLLH